MGFRAFRIDSEDGKTVARLTDLDLADLSQGSVVIRCAYSSVNYKDALAGTGTGKVVRRFTVLMKCSWNGDDGVLDEDFTYSDGKKERRVWRLKKLGNGRYTGTADDVVGTAQGQAAGNAFQWAYTLRLPVDDKVYEVQFDDWMYLVDEHVMLNKAVMSKFGIRLGEVTLAFTKK